MINVNTLVKASVFLCLNIHDKIGFRIYILYVKYFYCVGKNDDTHCLTFSNNIVKYERK